MGIVAVYVQRHDDPEARMLEERLRLQGYETLSAVKIECVYRLEGDLSIESLLPLLVNPVCESYSEESSLVPEQGPVVEIGYQKAVTDPETPSILEGARALGVYGLEWARLSMRYQFSGISRDEALRIARTHLYNPVVQMIVTEGSYGTSLRPSGEPESVRRITLRGLSDAELVQVSERNSWYAPLEQMKAMQRYEEQLGRELTDAEIEIIVQSWSDHCYHTTWKSLGLLKILMNATESINHPMVVSVFKDNAGAIEFYDGYAVTLKGETHNFPSSIATFGGVTTKHGGVIRDTIGFGKGAYPIGGSTIMGTMDPRTPDEEVPAGALNPGHIVRESIRGTAYYCNPMGIPMMYSVYRAHTGYPKCLALGHSVGIIPTKYALKEKPVPGDKLVLIGGPTGRDGIHGATASSVEMTGETAEKESAAVQIGHPITERKFMEAIPLLRDSGFIRSITDLGAGGISCAAGEMGEPTGVEVDLDAVPLKDQSLSAWEILLSESQERMAMAIPADRVGDALRILERFNVDASIIGAFTDDRRFRAFWRGEAVVDIDMSFLWGDCPIPQAEVKAVEPVQTCCSEADAAGLDLAGLPDAAKRVLGHYHCCDQSQAGFQFDSTVQGRTVVGPYGGKTGKMPTNVFVAAPLRGKPYGVVSTIAYNPFYGDVDSAGLVRLLVVEAITRAVVAGADPRAIALNDNFYTPRYTPEVGWHLKRMVEAAASVSKEFGTPFISGKDSSSGTFLTTDGKSIDVPLTFAVATVGKMADVSRVKTKDFKSAGSSIVLVGGIDPTKLGGSVYLDCFGKRGSKLYGSDDPDLTQRVKKLWYRLHDLYGRGDCSVRAASAVGEGGVFIRLFEMAYGGGLGVDLSLDSSAGSLEGLLFSECIGSVLVEVSSDSDLPELLGDLPYLVLGRTISEPAIRVAYCGDSVELPMDDLVTAWESTFGEVVL
jgi:phosphoribosylformylglycinamidine synthase